MCVVYVCGIWMHVPTSLTWRLKLEVGILPQLSPLLPWDRPGSMGFLLGCLSLSLPLNSGVTGTHACTQLFCGCWEFNLWFPNSMSHLCCPLIEQLFLTTIMGEASGLTEKKLVYTHRSEGQGDVKKTQDMQCWGMKTMWHTLFRGDDFCLSPERIGMCSDFSLFPSPTGIDLSKPRSARNSGAGEKVESGHEQRGMKGDFECLCNVVTTIWSVKSDVSLFNESPRCLWPSPMGQSWDLQGTAFHEFCSVTLMTS